ncbi:Diacylglycerol kinase 3 [Glycine soja]|uniref:Diacylglycerol kinase 3 n=1 Tax=Glycine soja TaxID=3848 RepID=A0A0B2SFL9_GLYSO|nr:Eye-specific diacylglycerol kinase [Glycine soja]RZC16534.1 Diacylglycerol kinase 3 [Glycine soja]
MDSPSSSTTGDTSKVPIKSSSSIVESLRGCGISSGTHVDKEELRKNLTMPKYLRFAMRDSIMFKDPTAGENLCIRSKDDHKAVAPSTPMIVFINPRSGGRHGPFLKERLQHLMSEEQVLDMLDVKPHEFLQYGLGCLEMLTGLGDSCAKETRKRIRIMVAGGDGSVGWVLGCLTKLHEQGREPIPPVGIIPLGTGNDLSRSFGWGGSFPFSWKAAIKRTLYKASIGPICRLDRYILSYSFAR